MALAILISCILLTGLLIAFKYTLFDWTKQNTPKFMRPLNFEIIIGLLCSVIFVGISYSTYRYLNKTDAIYLNPEGQFEIGKAFYKGDTLPKDNLQALHWFRLAASNGHKQAESLTRLFGNYGKGENGDSDSGATAQNSAGSSFAVDIIPPRKIKSTLNNIAGLSEAKSEVQQFVDLIKNPEKFQAIGAKPPKGLILYGLPGTGKTLLARAIAGEANRTFISVAGSAFEETYVGTGAARVRELFEIARRNQPALIFIDEIDALAPARGTQDLSQSHIQTVNQLLSELQNLNEEKNANVFVIAATNRIEAIDPALLRPGRFDWQLHVRLPNSEDREAVLKKFTAGIKAAPNLDINILVEKSAGFSSADLSNLVNEAAIIAVKNNKSTVDQASFEAAFQKIATYEKDLSPAFSIKIISPNEIKTRLSDIAGMNEAKREVTEIIDFLKNPKAFTRLGAKPPTGILIYGPPGTGKTMMARALAGDSNATFIAVSGSDFDERYVGVGASRVRELFKLARKYKPCVVFIDEIDTLAKERHSDDTTGQDQTLNQFLNEMDNVQNNVNEGIIFIGATNRIDVLDPAILRPGRFDRKVYFRLPSLLEREDILKSQLKSIQYAKDVDVKTLAKITTGYSGADLANLVNEAAIEATRKNKKLVDMSDFEEANDKIALGVYQGNGSFSEAEKRRTAYHEAGHALVGLLNPDHPRTLHKLTIGLRGQTLGVTHFRMDTDEYSYTKKQLEALIATSLGGYAAEEIVYGKNDVSSGASSDLVNANQLAKDMVAKYGMGDDDSLIVTQVFPEDSAVLGNAEDIIKRDYQLAKDLLIKNRDKLDLLAKTLLEKETLDYNQIMTLLKIPPTPGTPVSAKPQ